MSRQDDIQRLMRVHNRRLQMLETQSAASGPQTPAHLLAEISDIKTALLNLQAELAELEKGELKEPPPKIAELYYATKGAIQAFRRTYDTLAEEMIYISGEAQAKAARLLEQAKERLLEAEKDWQAIDHQTASAEETLKALKSKISAADQGLHILKLRRNYRRRFSLLEEQLAKQALVLTGDNLQAAVQPQLRQIQQQIQMLEVKEELTPHDQSILKIYWRNLDLCQQMLAGSRPYAPLPLLGELTDVEQTLKDMDLQLARS